MTQVLACVDGSVYADSVADHAAWAARGLDASVEVLQVLGRREAQGDDFSGRVMPDGQRQLLDRLSSLDAERFKLLQQNARLGLEAARLRIEAAGVADVTATLRTGDLLDEMAAREAGADLVVVGKRGEAADFAKLHLGSNLERIVRASPLPVLIAARAFRPIRTAVVAFDGRSNALKALDAISRSPLARGIAFQIVTAGKATEEGKRQLDAALSLLRSGGLEADGRIEDGEPVRVIGAAIEGGADLLVMGAYGHSRLRSLFIGSVTAELIRSCRVPALIYR
jgi:nucleotide-binding universal stress UspA family protein